MKYFWLAGAVFLAVFGLFVIAEGLFDFTDSGFVDGNSFGSRATLVLAGFGLLWIAKQWLRWYRKTRERASQRAEQKK